MNKSLRFLPLLRPCLIVLLGLAGLQQIRSQCTNSSPFGSVNAPTNNVPVTISSCTFAGEYNTINSAVAGTTYQFTGTGGAGNYITIRQGTPGGVVLAHGFSPVNATCTVSGPLYLHLNTDAACGTDGTCHTTTVQCTSCGGAGDPCASITNLSCGTAVTSTHNGGGLWSPGSCGFSTPGQEKVYSFTPTTTGIHTVQVNSATGGYVDYFWKAASGGCNATGWTCIDDIIFTGTYNIGTLTAGVQYYFLLDPEGSGAYSHNFQIVCPAPAADPCASITPLSCGVAVSATPSGTGIWNPLSCGFSTPGQEKVYSFTPTNSGVHQLQVNSVSGGYIDYFWKDASGGCNSTGWTCIDDINFTGTFNIGSLTAGVQYYLLLDPEGTGSYNHNFQIVCPSAGAPPCVANPTSPTNGQTNICPSATQPVSWMPSPGATSYDVYFGTTNPPPFVANTLFTSYTANTPTSGTYYWQIRPVGPGGTASGCSIWSFSKQDVTLPNITCPASIIANNNPATACSAQVVYGSITATDNCGAPTITLQSGLPSNSVFPVGVNTVVYRATDGSGNTRTCSFTVTVRDVTPPTITCPANIVRNNDANLCSAVVTYPNASATDNCSGVTVAYFSGLPSGAAFPVGLTTVVFRATDAATNTATCSFTVRVNDVQPPSITCPPPLNLPNTFGQCGRAINWVGQATATDNCSVTSNQSNSTGYFPVGDNIVIHTAGDPSGNTATCTQLVTIYDNEPPVVICPANIVAKTDENDCVATVDYAATGSDNCPGAIITYSTDPLSTFDVGLTNVVVTGTDASGNVNTCTFQIRVDTREEVCNDVDDDCDGIVDEAQDWEKVAKVLAGDGNQQDQYGISVDIDGDYAIVGSNQKIPGGQSLGAAYILHRTAGGWAQEAKLLPADVEPGDLFGASVSIHNGVAAVGAPFDDDPVGNEGAVYVFYRDGAGNWNLVKKVKATDADPADNFGTSVDLNGGRMLVGASLDDETASNAGAAYVCAQNAGGADNWGQEAKLLAITGAADDNMGGSVSLSGDYAIVGATGVDGLFQNRGAAYVFGRNQAGWSQIARLSAPQSTQNDNFGVSVGISGGWAIVGADQNDLNGTDAGAAFIFYKNRNGIFDSWGLQNVLLDYNGAAGDRFGSSVAIDGDYAVVGAKGDGTFGQGSGGGFIYLREGNNWILVTQVADGAGQSGDNLGASAGISGRTAILGAPLDNDGGAMDEGSVVIFEGLCSDDGQRPSLRDEVDPAGALALHCYPVPFSDVLNVEVRNLRAADVQVTVYNTLGQEVASLYRGSAEGDLTFQWRPAAQIGQGLYFLRVNADGKISTKTLTLSR